METLWFSLTALMLAAYVVFDGFDLGAGIIHLAAAKDDPERRLILRSIGPVWDGNEVWLIAAGGTLYFAFPKLYASSFSGFYLPLMIVLWLLMLRAISIEFRAHMENRLAHEFFDLVFSFSSMLLAIFFGAALGNVVRGVPLDESGYFFLPLWTNFQTGALPGILDWYTILTGLISFAALTSHGSLYIAVKTSGELNARCRRIAKMALAATAILTVLGLAATLMIRPEALNNYTTHWYGAFFPLAVLSGLGGMALFGMKANDKAAFVSSSLYLAGMIGGAAFGLYPNVLPSTVDPSRSLTIYNAAANSYGLKIGLVWWTIGIVLAIGYFIFTYRLFRGKTTLEGSGY